MTKTNPLYFTGKTPEGKLLLGGVFKMHDQEGFPIEASFEECQRRGWLVDWMEALADCWLNNPLKFDAFVANAELLVDRPLKAKFSFAGASWIEMNKASPSVNQVDDFCFYVLKNKQDNAIHP